METQREYKSNNNNKLMTFSIRTNIIKLRKDCNYQGAPIVLLKIGMVRLRFLCFKTVELFNKVPLSSIFHESQKH